MLAVWINPRNKKPLATSGKMLVPFPCSPDAGNENVKRHWENWTNHHGNSARNGSGGHNNSNPGWLRGLVDHFLSYPTSSTTNLLPRAALKTRLQYHYLITLTTNTTATSIANTISITILKSFQPLWTPPLTSQKPPSLSTPITTTTANPITITTATLVNTTITKPHHHHHCQPPLLPLLPPLSLPALPPHHHHPYQPHPNIPIKPSITTSEYPHQHHHFPHHTTTCTSANTFKDTTTTTTKTTTTFRLN